MKPLIGDFVINTGNGWGTAITIAILLLWLIALIELLKRQDMKEVDKIVWTIVLCVLNVFGLLLYWFMAPREKGPVHVRTEKELKDHFNSRANKPDQ